MRFTLKVTNDEKLFNSEKEVLDIVSDGALKLEN